MTPPSSSHRASFEDEPSGRALATGRNSGKTTSGIGLHADAAGETPVLHEKLAASAVASAHIAFFPQLRPSREDCSEGVMASGPFHGGQDTIPRVFHAHRPRSWTSSHAFFPVGPCAVPTGKKTPRKPSRRSRNWTYGQTKGLSTGICTKKGQRRTSFGGPEGRLIPLPGGPRGCRPWGQREARGISTGICTKKGHRRESMTFFRGDSRIRTGDPLLAKQVLYQLSYTPEVVPGRR